MSTEDKAEEALDAAIAMVLRIPRKDWRDAIWQVLKEFCEEQLGENK